MKKFTKTETKKILEGMVNHNIKLPDDVTVDELQNVLNMMIGEVPFFTKYDVPIIYKRFCTTNPTYEEIGKELGLSREYIRVSCTKEIRFIKTYINVYRENLEVKNNGITLETDFVTTCFSELSTRTRNSLYRAGIDTFGDVKKLIESVESKPTYLPFNEKCKVKNLGPKGYEEMVNIFKSHGGEAL